MKQSWPTGRGVEGDGRNVYDGTRLLQRRLGKTLIGDVIRQIRQNHALEHATVAALLERGVQPPLAGYSVAGGFFIFARASQETVDEAAFEALVRLNEGQRDLAISPHCGTNVVSGALLAGLLSALILGHTRSPLKRLPLAAGAIIGATFASRPLGNALQRRYTTLADVSNLRIAGITRLWALPSGRRAVYRVRTRFGPR